MNNPYIGPEGFQAPYRDQENQDFRDVKIKIRQHINYHVIGHMSDGSKVDGIIEDMDDDGVTMLVGEDMYADTDEGMRQFGGYGGGYGGGYRRRYRRYRRRRYPYNYFVFPFFVPYPYYY
ncbi:hypothetical protein ELQ35_11390 [Peribacillus cavernae]|uniref:Uncharacterized protein n=1 Tax=Peribacillus cavernae TaxID=1674310 RepID=A0A3S0W6I1_9BACI|nr:hypothetical protein [Peribacillus cavernae]MDQ0220222.1 hypothetical protein [Peribacillus cavernae]RUQ28839.1 hypothetical protein ELQ35_11390 [Peribacillus cavernae]